MIITSCLALMSVKLDISGAPHGSHYGVLESEDIIPGLSPFTSPGYSIVHVDKCLAEGHECCSMDSNPVLWGSQSADVSTRTTININFKLKSHFWRENWDMHIKH